MLKYKFDNVVDSHNKLTSAVEVRGAVHIDFGTLTLLTQDQTGGLQVQRRDGTWTFLQPIPGGL
jgi:isopenicillin N synthase-like dioxygenase